MFKVGMKIKFVKSIGDNDTRVFTKGKFYIIIESYPETHGSYCINGFQYRVLNDQGSAWSIIKGCFQERLSNLTEVEYLDNIQLNFKE